MNERKIDRYSWIKSDRIEQYSSDKNLNDHFSSHTWNEDGGDFDQRL